MLQKAESQETNPETSEDFLEQGAVDEESGDRWLGSDLAKAIRFYQRAYHSYLTALKKPIGDDNVKLDIYYNISRLVFHVYNHYFQSDGIFLDELPNIDEVLHNDESVVQDLATIVETHEATIELSHTLGLSVLTDLLYNTGLVYTQVIEELENGDIGQVVEIGLKNQAVFRQLLQIQVSSLQNFVSELDHINDHDTTAPQQSENAIGEEVLQPPDIFDTVLSCYKLSQAMLESVSNAQELSQVKDLINPFLLTCDNIATELLGSFSEGSNTKAEYLSSITASQINEFHIAQISIQALFLNDLTEILAVWDTKLPELPEIPEKYMVLVDNVQEFLDRNDITLNNCNNTTPEMVNTFWKALTIMTNNLKKAQDLLAAEKQKLQTNGLDNLGTVLAIISNVIIKRSDIDLQRAQLNHEQGQKSQAILLQNCKTFLKNAMNTANLSGGLREKVSEKHGRNQRKVEAVLRMCILEGKTLVEKLDTILGRGKWTREVPHLVKLEYFDAMGIKQICLY